MEKIFNCLKCKSKSIICLKILMEDNSKKYRCLKCNEQFSNIQKQNSKIGIIYK